jgi:hypothetical protein
VSTAQAVKKAKYASDAGVDFIQFNPPHYMRPTSCARNPHTGPGTCMRDDLRPCYRSYLSP